MEPLMEKQNEAFHQFASDGRLWCLRWLGFASHKISGNLEKEDLATKLYKLSKKLKDGQVEVYEALQKKYGEFDASLNTTMHLSTRARNMVAEMEGVASKINNEIKPQLNNSTKEFKELKIQLEESNAVLAILGKLVKIHENLVESRTVQRKKNFKKAADLLNEIEEELAKPISENENQLKILLVLKEEYVKQREKFVQDLGTIWSQKVRWTLPEESSDDNKVKCQLSISSEISTNEMSSILGAMQTMHVLDTYIALFGSRLMNYFIKPLVIDKSFDVNPEELPGIIQVQLVTENSSELNESRAPMELILQIWSLLDILNKHLLGIEIQDGNDKKPLMYYMGRLFSHEFITLIINECLAKAIPSSTSELKSYKTIVESTETFQEKLIESQFLSPSDCRMMEYVGNVNELYAAKKSKEVLIQARKLMTSDIHNVVKISADSPFGDLKPLGNESDVKATETIALKHYPKLSDETYHLPTCCISESTQKLMCLAYQLLHEAQLDHQQGVVQVPIFYTVRGMFDLYCHVVPTYHKESLLSLPQLTAIHHNNCMFIAHHLLTLGHQFRHSLPQIMQSSVVATFVDLVPRIRRIGTEGFLEQMSKQRDQMLEYLKGAEGFQNVNENRSAADRAIKQCLHQLQHLHRVWKEVLPKAIFCKSLGTLLNAVLVEIINSIVSLEDISEENAHVLHSLMSTVKEKAPALFDIGDNEFKLASVHSSTPKWTKFNELMIVLDAGLVEISDRWADGKGPLAEAFSAKEVKLLIRALFQNTEKRAAVLAKVR